MPQYASFDNALPDPKPVTGWFDTDAFAYGRNLPPAQNLLELSPSQWQGRLAGSWAIAGGALVAAATPAPSPAQQAMTALAAGLAITSSGTPALDATYAVDSGAQARIIGVSVYILKNNSFPGGATTFAWPDTGGALHTFPSVAEFEAFATAVANYVAALDLILLTDSGALPAASATIA